MGNFIAYLDTSEVRPGKLDELKEAMAGLAAFVEQNEPQILSYCVYFSEDGSTMKVLHLHTGLASLELHLTVAGAKFPPVAPLITMKSIEVFGHPTEDLLARLRAKARLLGTGAVTVHEVHAGFARFLTA
ncbi:hypothetical protein [Arthrobacter sp. C152]